MKNTKCQFGDLIFIVRNIKGIWKLDFTWNGKRQRPSMEMGATPENLETIKRVVLPELYLELSGRKIDSIALNIQAPKTLIFGDYAEQSIELQRHEVEGHVLWAKKQILKRDILPMFGSRKLSAILPSDVKVWQNSLAERLSLGTIKKYRGVLSHILDDAWRDGLIIENPCLKIKLPKNTVATRYDKQEMHPFTEDEIHLILKSEEGYMKNFFQISFFSGIRPGELLALEWGDISFGTKHIRIKKTIKRSGEMGGWKDGKTKTLASNRIIDMLPQAEEALRSQFLETGLKNSKVFLNRYGKPWSGSDYFNVQFKSILRRVGIIQRNMYNTRHTFASQMLAKKIDIGWISKTMGHVNIQITLQRYAKYIPKSEEQREAFLSQFVTLFVTPVEKMA